MELSITNTSLISHFKVIHDIAEPVLLIQTGIQQVY